MQGLAGINQGSNCIELPYGYQIWLEELDPNQSVMHCWSQRSCRDQPDVIFPKDCLIATKSARKNLKSMCNALHCWSMLELQVMQSQLGGKTRGQIA